MQSKPFYIHSRAALYIYERPSFYLFLKLVLSDPITGGQFYHMRLHASLLVIGSHSPTQINTNTVKDECLLVFVYLRAEAMHFLSY